MAQDYCINQTYPSPYQWWYGLYMPAFQKRYPYLAPLDHYNSSFFTLLAKQISEIWQNFTFIPIAVDSNVIWFTPTFRSTGLSNMKPFTCLLPRPLPTKTVILIGTIICTRNRLVALEEQACYRLVQVTYEGIIGKSNHWVRTTSDLEHRPDVASKGQIVGLQAKAAQSNKQKYSQETFLGKIKVT